MASVLALSVALSNKAEAAATVPSFEVVTLGGETFSKDSLKGHPTLLVFWAPWCKVCQRELPLLSQFASKEKPGRLAVISIGFADSRGNVSVFVKAHPANQDTGNAAAGCEGRQHAAGMARPQLVDLDAITLQNRLLKLEL